MKLKIGKNWEQPDSTQNLKVLIKKSVQAGPPGAERGRGASSNMTDFRSCEVQNGRRKCLSLIQNVMWSQKKGLHRTLKVFPARIRWSQINKKKFFELYVLVFQCHFHGPPLMPMGPLLGSEAMEAPLKPVGPHMGPLKSMGLGVIVPLFPLSAALCTSKGEFTQYPFFVRFRPFFYVFASPWKSMRFFIRIFISPYTH